eukprot:scaffold18.g1907.t1
MLRVSHICRAHVFHAPNLGDGHGLPSFHSAGAYSGPAVAFYVNCIHAVNSSGLEGRPQAAAGVAAAAARVGISLSRLPQPGLPLAMGERKSKMNKHKHRKRLKREGRKSK